MANQDAASSNSSAEDNALVPEIEEKNHDVIHGVAGGIGSVMAMALLYPMDYIRTLLQVQIRKKKKSRVLSQGSLNKYITVDEEFQEYKYSGVIDCVQQIIKQDGWQRLYR